MSNQERSEQAEAWVMREIDALTLSLSFEVLRRAEAKRHEFEYRRHDSDCPKAKDPAAFDPCQCVRVDGRRMDGSLA